MLTQRALALMLSTALMTGAAVAQTTTPSTTPPPAATSPMPVPTQGTGFVTEQMMGQFRASKFIGLAIYGPDNARVGDINEVIMDGAGSAKAIVIGVGGFLGIGEKNVAVPWTAVEWMNERPPQAASAMATPPATAPGVTAAPTPTTGMAATTGMGASTPASTVASTASTTPARSPAETAAANGYPDHGMIRMTRSDLQNAPTFRYYGQSK